MLLGLKPTIRQPPILPKPSWQKPRRRSVARWSISPKLSKPPYHRLKITPPPDPATYGMSNLVSIDWGGPVEPLVAQIAASSGYKIRVLGNPPAVPVMVFLSVKNVPLGNVLRDIGFQVNTKANIVVFPRSKVIELRYAKH